ncbi:hypothetical protein PISMIDRAFT_14810 [Pisolithus microcarpus 441]|uniref:Uncharacterized protein n=1 Tax=Pisolithus microcarpus 441 TaxID=765257 RepID=A0A0C9XZ87_9AGAM|nr:hypothetical protein PISMIDRAFT_14810 [Pisolithus microcarpus 441]
MPLNGPEALGWALAILVVLLVLGHAQAMLLFSLYGGSFSLAVVMSCVMWGTFLGIPSWHGIFAAYQEYHIQLGRFRELRVRAAVTIEAREVSALPRTERLALPCWNPPSYQALEIRNLDLEADMDPVPPYPMSPQGYPMVLSEPFNLSIEETQELHHRWVEMQPQHRASHVSIIVSDSIHIMQRWHNIRFGSVPDPSTTSLPHLVEELPPTLTPEGDDEASDLSHLELTSLLLLQMSAVVVNRNNLTGPPAWASRPFPIAVEKETALAMEKEIYLPKCPNWKHAISQNRTQYTRSPFPWHVIPSIAVEQTWESIPRNFADRCPEDEPLVNQKVHLTFHGFLVNCLPKISAASTPHARANFNGVDIPSFTYEDPALETVPALALTNNTFFYFRGRVHPCYDYRKFHGIIPALRIWNQHLERDFRRVWTSNSIDPRHVPRILQTRHRDGRVSFDPKVVLLLMERWDVITWGMEQDVNRAGYDAEREHLWWRSPSRSTNWVNWPSTASIYADLERECEKGSGEDIPPAHPRGIYRRNRRSTYAAASIKPIPSSGKST